MEREGGKKRLARWKKKRGEVNEWKDGRERGILTGIGIYYQKPAAAGMVTYKWIKAMVLYRTHTVVSLYLARRKSVSLSVAIP